MEPVYALVPMISKASLISISSRGDLSLLYKESISNQNTSEKAKGKKGSQDIVARFNIIIASSGERALQELNVSFFVFVNLLETPSNPVWIAGFFEVFLRVLRQATFIKRSFQKLQGEGDVENFSV